MKQQSKKRSLIILALIVLGIFIIVFIQSNISNSFEKEEKINIEALHPNEQSYVQEIDFNAQEQKKEYKLTNFEKKDYIKAYKDVVFDQNNSENNIIKQSDNTIISILILIGIVCLVGFSLKKIIKNI